MVGLEILETHHPLVICEGTAEEVVFNKLLEADKLVFTSNMLHDIMRTRGVRKIQEEYLSFRFDYPVCIVRLADSPSERFELTSLYKERFPVQDNGKGKRGEMSRRFNLHESLMGLCTYLVLHSAITSTHTPHPPPLHLLFHSTLHSTKPWHQEYLFVVRCSHRSAYACV